MISHDFVQIAEGFRANDDDLIGSKLFNSPRSKGEFVPLKYSSSLDRFFPNYAGPATERPTPQGMTVVNFASELKEKGQSSKSVIKTNEKAKSGTENGQENNNENGVDHSKHNGKEKGTENGKEEYKENGTDKSKGDGNGQENGEGARRDNGDGTTKEHDKEGQKSGEGEKEANGAPNVSTTSDSHNTVQAEAGTTQPETTPNHSDATQSSANDVPSKGDDASKKQAQKEAGKEQGTADPNLQTQSDPVPKKSPVRVLSGRALMPKEFIPREHATGSEHPMKKAPSQPEAVHKQKVETGGSKLLRSPTQQALAALQQQVQLEPFSKDWAFKTKSTVTSPSALTISLTERPLMVKNLKASKLMIPDSQYHVPCLQLVVFVLIHSSFLPNKLNTLRLAPNATVEQVIEVAVKRLNDMIEKHRPEDPLLIPAKCQLLLAEEDGRPDADTPVLQRDAAVHRLGCIYFALCKDPEEGVITADSKTFKVILPSKEYQVLSYKKSLSLGQVLEKVCSKRQLDPMVHYFVYTTGNKDVEINLDALVSDLETTEVTMKCRISRKHTVKNPLRPTLRSRSRNDVFAPSSEGHDSLAPPVLNPKLSRHLGVPKEFFWSPASVATYVQYTVIKINKYGKKQERIMGIDRERITNSMPVTKPHKTNRPARLMSDVVKAFIPERPTPISPSIRKPFSIEFKDGKTQDYESEKADEIVARVNYIVALETPPKSRSVE
jgi:hypothetical protein